MDDYKTPTLSEMINILNGYHEGKGRWIGDQEYLKIGEMKKCSKCGEQCDMIKYSDFDMFAWTNVLTTCVKCSTPYILKECKNESCKVHEVFDTKKYNESEEKHTNIIKKVWDLLNKVDPKSDSILEYDRFVCLFGSINDTILPDDYDLWVYEGFINYLASKGRITIPQKLGDIND